MKIYDLNTDRHVNDLWAVGAQSLVKMFLILMVYVRKLQQGLIIAIVILMIYVTQITQSLRINGFEVYRTLLFKPLHIFKNLEAKNTGTLYNDRHIF